MVKFRGTIIVVILCTLLTACQGGLGLEELRRQQYNIEREEGSYDVDYDVLDRGPVKGGTLKMFSTKPDTFHPLLTKNIYTSDFLSFVYEGLTRLDEKQQAVPVLSDHWSVSGDGLIWNFHIRDSVKWHDGQTLTAHDVEFTVKTLLTSGMDSVYKPFLLNIVTYAAVDSSNFKIVISKPNSFTPEMMTFPIIQENQLKQEDTLTVPGGFQPIGTGPYRFVSYTEGESAVLKYNEGWWYAAEEGFDIQKSMYLETILMNVFVNPDDAMGAFQAGEIDITTIEASDYVKYKGRTDLVIKRYTSRDYEFLALNLKNPVIADEFARKAIALAIDRDRLVNDILPGEAEAAAMPVLPSSWISDIEESNDATGNIYNDVVTNTTDGAINTSGAAIEAKTPKEALLAGGWKESKQGYYKFIGGMRRYLKVEIIVNSTNSTRVRAAEKICSMLEQAGITAECKQLGWSDLLTTLNTGKYDIAFTGCRIPQIPDISYLYSSNYLPSQLPAKPESARNIAGYFSLQVDEYIEALFRENSVDRKRTIYSKLMDTISKDTPYIGLYFLRDAMVYSKNIKGPIKPDTWNRYYDMTHWYKPELP